MIRKVLVTGAAGFIGKHVVNDFLKKGCEVVGVDDLNDFTYPSSVKFSRLASLGLDVCGLLEGDGYCKSGNFCFHEVDVTDAATLQSMIFDGEFDLIVHLAGFTSVSASSLSPNSFLKTNLGGFCNVLEGIRMLSPSMRPRLLWASSAAVYGNVSAQPLSEDDKNLIRPSSIYGVSKCMMEDLAETYARLYSVGSVALRFFNIYGPYERPDTFIRDVACALLANKTLYRYEENGSGHDYMYIEDCIRAVNSVIDKWPLKAESEFKIFNVGTGKPVLGSEVIAILEDIAGKKLNIENRETPAGEIHSLSADTHKFTDTFDFKVQVELREGLQRFFNWLRPFFDKGL